MELFGTTGQERRAWLDRKAGDAFNALSYYLGPTGIPERLGAGANLLAYTDAGDMVEAGEASRALWSEPSLQNAARYATAGAALSLPFIGARGVNELSNNAIDWMADESGAIRAWHGSPHDFDRFSMDKIGTGEGAQVYGHGLYFAEEPAVAKGYRDALSLDAGFTYKGQSGLTRDQVAELIEADFGRGYLDNVTTPRGVADRVMDDLIYGQRDGRQLGPERAALTEQLRAAIGKSDPGRLYEVEINANPEDFLDWDAPLSAQPESVRNLLGDNLPRKPAFEEQEALIQRLQAQGVPPEQIGQHPEFLALERQMDEASALDRKWPMGGNIYESSRIVPGDYRDPVAASARLREAGIPGIRYLDAGSRGAGDGSRNYVVFSDELITILNKYGVAGLTAGALGASSLPTANNDDL